MSPEPRHLIENPLSGERITINAAQPGGGVLEWELMLAPGGRVPSSHAHPRQEECFTVLAGRMRFRVGGRRLTAGPGDTVRSRPARCTTSPTPAASSRPGKPACRAGKPGPSRQNGHLAVVRGSG
jgi:hypothetical protein